MDRFFNMDNKFFTFMGRVADLMILNILCIVCCIPVITAGASITAMFYVTLKMVRNEESYIVKGFFKSFKENFKQSIPINLIMIVTALLIYFDMTVAKSMEGTAGNVLFMIFLVILIIYVMIFVYIYPLLAKFYNTVKNTFINAFLMSIRHLPYTLLMIVISALPLCVFLINNSQVTSMVILFLVLMGASTIAYANSHFLVKIFDNYIPKEEDAEKKDEAAEIAEDTATLIAKDTDQAETAVNPADETSAVPDEADTAADAAKPAEPGLPSASEAAAKSSKTDDNGSDKEAANLTKANTQNAESADTADTDNTDPNSTNTKAAVSDASLDSANASQDISAL